MGPPPLGLAFLGFFDPMATNSSEPLLVATDCFPLK
jgi:hypothetical protein